MAYFFRLVFYVRQVYYFALGSFFALVSVCAFASLPMTPAGKVWTTAGQAANGVPLMESAVFTGSNQGAESQAACNAMGKFSYPNGSQGTIYYSAGGGGCFVGGLGALTTRNVSASCPANSEQSGSVCVCTSGSEEVNGSCKPNPCLASHPEGGWHEEGGACVKDNCDADEVRVNGVCVKEPPCPSGQTRVNGVCKDNGCKSGSSGMYLDVGDGETNYSCYQGCSYRTRSSTCVFYNGVASCAGEMIGLGSKCDTNNTPPPPKPPASSPANPTNPSNPSDPNSPGGGNGNGGGGIPPMQPSAPKPDGTCDSGTHKNGDSCYKDPTNPDGDGKCPSGSVKVDTKCVFSEPPKNDDKEDDFCKKNPDTPMCKNSAWSGSCGAFSCDGDAIQCSMAREQHERDCTLFEGKSSELDLYNSEKDKNGKVTDSLLGNKNIDISSKISDVDQFLGGGGVCPADTVVEIMDRSLSIPWSSYCWVLQLLGHLNVAAAAVIAALIVVRRG